MISTIAYWKLAEYVNLKNKWLLFVPLYRSVYIGAVVNICARELHPDKNDYSVLELVTILCMLGSLYLNYIYGTDMTLMVLFCVLLFYVILRTVEHYLILNLLTRSPILATILSWLPGVMLYHILDARKRLG